MSPVATGSLLCQIASHSISPLMAKRSSAQRFFREDLCHMALTSAQFC